MTGETLQPLNYAETEIWASESAHRSIITIF